MFRIQTYYLIACLIVTGILPFVFPLWKDASGKSFYFMFLVTKNANSDYSHLQRFCMSSAVVIIFFLPPSINAFWCIHTILNETVMTMINTTHDHFTFKNTNSFLHRQPTWTLCLPAEAIDRAKLYDVYHSPSLPRTSGIMLARCAFTWDDGWHELMGRWTDLFS